MSKRLLLGIVSIILAVLIAAGMLIFNLALSSQMVTAYVTTSEINEGEQIDESLIEEIKIHKKDLTSINFVSSSEEIVGKFAAVDISKNDVITQNKISNVATSTDNQFLSIPSGKQAISFSVKGGADSLSNKLQAGDLIRIYSYNNDGGVISPDELKYVEVASVTSSDYKDVDNSANTESEDETTSYSTITVIVYTSQVEQLIKIQNEGGVYVTLISRGNAAVSEQLLKEQENILGGIN